MSELGVDGYAFECAANNDCHEQEAAKETECADCYAEYF